MKRLAKAWLERLGYDIRRRPPAPVFPRDPFQAQKIFMERLGVAAPTVFDVGAHHGETYLAYRAVFPAAKIYCFEPSPESCERVRTRAAGDPSAKTIQAAVADRTGVSEFHLNASDATHSLLPRNREGRRYYPAWAAAKATIEVPTTTIDETIAREGIERLHILKLDIQGGELLALKGAARALGDTPVPVIYTETMFIPHYQGQPLLLDLWSFVAGRGYSLFDLYGIAWGSNGQLRYGDAIFVSRELREKVIDAFPDEP
jgi:FkbM family methyltransferase